MNSALAVIERTALGCGLSVDDIAALVAVATSNKLRKFYTNNVVFVSSSCIFFAAWWQITNCSTTVC